MKMEILRFIGKIPLLYASTTSAPTANFTLLADFQALLDDQGNVVIYR
jgi:hypothetical protein